MKCTPLQFVVPKKRPVGTKWLIVLPTPSQEEVVLRQAFVGENGKFLRELFTSHGFNLDEFAVHYLVPEFQKESLTKEQVLLSTIPLIETFKNYVPDRVILMGVDCVNALYGYGKRKNGHTLAEFRGFYTDYQLFPDYTIPVFATFNPEQVLEAPTAFFDDFNGDVGRLLQMGWLQQPEFVIVSDILSNSRALRALAYNSDTCDGDVRAFDIETTGLDFHENSSDSIVSLSICGSIDTVYIWNTEALNNTAIQKALQKFFNDKRLEIVAHNGIAFDCPFMFWKLGINIPCYWDTMLEHYLLDERRNSHSLKRLGLRYFGIPNWEGGIIAAKEKQKLIGNKVNYGDFDKEVLYGYQSYDTVVTYLLHNRFKPLVCADFKKLYDGIIYPAARMLENIRTRGIKVDSAYLKNLGTEWDKELKFLDADLKKILIGHGYADLNLNSTQQLSKFLHEELKLPRINAKLVAKTGGGKMKDKYDSTSEAVLTALEPKDTSGFITKLLCYRRLTGLKSKYVTGILELLSPEGFIYPNLLLHGTETGRLSCTKPNLMAVPKESRPLMGMNGLIPYAEQIRHAFIPREGFKIVTSDYSQIELRMLAWLSNDESMIEAFKSGVDFHLATAFIAFGYTDDPDKQKVIRKKAKTVNFALVYRMGIASLAAALGVSLAEAAATKKAVLSAYKALDAYMENEVKISLKRGYSESLFGRRRRFPLVSNPKIKALFERLSVNHPAQSSASDYCLQAAIEIDRTFTSDEVNVLLLIHDDIVCEVAEGRVEELTAKIVAIQEKHRLQNKGGLIFKAEPDILSAWAELPKAKEIDYNDISIIIDQIDENFEVSEQEAYAI